MRDVTVNIPTLIAYSSVLLAVISLLFLVFWLRDGRKRFLLWCSLPFVMGFCGSAVLAYETSFPDLWTARAGVVFLLAAYGFGWQAVRAFYGYRSAVPAVILLVGVWALFSATLAVPFHLEAVSGAIRAGLVALFNGLAAYEAWRSRGEDLPSRPALFRLFAAYALLHAARVPFAAVLPAPLGEAPTAVWSVILYNLAAITEALLVSAFMIAMTRERTAMQHHRAALRDPLTGVLNRRAFDAVAEAQAKPSPAARTKLALLLFDIDAFKSINDRFGHGIGDEVILLAARTAERVMRRQDGVFRIGGEEFVCLLPGLSSEQALIVAERIRLAFQRAARTVSDCAVRATVSVGIAAAEWGPGDLRELLARADQALYEAKRGGRNRSVGHEVR